MAQLEVVLMLRIGEKNRNHRENLEDFNISHILRCAYLSPGVF